MHIKNEREPLIVFENFLNKQEDNDLFEYFKDNIKWTQDKYNFSGKTILSPRLTFFYGKSYKYSGQTKIGIPFDEKISKLANSIEKFLDLNENYFNGCLLNYYRDGKDSISYHNDNEKDMDKNGIIAVVSIGSERKFNLKNTSNNEVKTFDLKVGSLAIMNPICQENYKHAINKEPNVTQGRISLTFRKFIN